MLPYQPRLIVLHVGGNDVHNGRTPAQVLADFQAFVARVRASCRACGRLFEHHARAGRWDEAPQRVVTNQVMRRYIATQPDLAFVDLWDAMLTPAGQPREDLWVEDRCTLTTRVTLFA